jgi:hypothetical protein
MQTRRLLSALQRIGAILASGTLLQAGSCDLAVNQAAADLTTAVVSALVNNLVFGAFNLTS